MELLIVSFFAGILTVLAPCILPLLPIILAGSSEDVEDKKGPYVIIASLAISIIIFSILLKGTTLFIDIPQSFWANISGGIIFIFGILTLFPSLWKKIASKTKIDQKSNEAFSKSTQKKGNIKNILMGLSLGPIFSSCSPTYALILAIILPKDIFIGLLNLTSYVIGLSLILLLIAVFGQRIVSKLKFFANPNGYFKKGLGLVFLIIGIAIMTGLDKKLETKILDSGYFDVTKIESKILDKVEPDIIN